MIIKRAKIYLLKHKKQKKFIKLQKKEKKILVQHSHTFLLFCIAVVENFIISSIFIFFNLYFYDLFLNELPALYLMSKIF